MVKILVVAEMQLGRSKPANRAAIRFAQDLAQRTGGAFHIALIGHQLGDAAAELNRYGAAGFITIDAPRFEHYRAQSFTDAVVALVRDQGFEAVIGGEATTSRDIFPRSRQRSMPGCAKGPAPWSMSMGVSAISGRYSPGWRCAPNAFAPRCTWSPSIPPRWTRLKKAPPVR
jgi:hypothetical protein